MDKGTGGIDDVDVSSPNFLLYLWAYPMSTNDHGVALDVKDILVTYKEDFKKNAELVYYLDALMLLSSLQDELDFQVAEYGANVALEDMRYLEELLDKFPET